jgi:hypothetical protein
MGINRGSKEVYFCVTFRCSEERRVPDIYSRISIALDHAILHPSPSTL